MRPNHGSTSAEVLCVSIIILVSRPLASILSSFSSFESTGTQSISQSASIAISEAVHDSSDDEELEPDEELDHPWPCTGAEIKLLRGISTAAPPNEALSL